MCGIIGVTVNGNGTFPVDISPLVRSLHHRGPDDSGSVAVDAHGHTVCLGQTRLSILDLSQAGHQPMASRDGRWWVTYNGEIYNHLGIRDELGGQFRGHADTETLVEGLAAWGVERLLPKLNGMFAFGAVDTRYGKLYLARDPFGIKPLYYRDVGNSFAFASEVRALRYLAEDRLDIDPDALQTFLTLRYVPSPRTLWKDIKRIPPGYFLCYDLVTHNAMLHCFSESTKERFEGSIQDAAASYRGVLGRAVERQLLSDVPVGILLSGGIDSALVAALAKESGRDLPCFTVGFGDLHAECELNDAAETAAVLGLRHYPITVNPDELWDAVPDILGAVEEPLGTTSILPMWYLVRSARKEVTVVLTGQGSDEPWGGYTRYQAEIVRGLLPFPGLLRGLAPLCSLSPRLPEIVERALRTIPQRQLSRRFEEAYALYPAQERLLLTGRADDGGALGDIEGWLNWLEPSSLEPVEMMMRIDSRMNLADDLLIYGDKISMATALEARVPMLDPDVVRFIESLPLKYRVGLAGRKIVHKQTARAFLPSAIVNRRKRGFNVPFGTWLKNDWQQRVRERLLDKGLAYHEYVSRQAVECLLAEHIAGKRDHGRKLFALLMLAVWWEQQ